jgi:hypothetical protein
VPSKCGSAKVIKSFAANTVFGLNAYVTVVLVLLVEGVKANESPVIVIVIGVIAAFEIVVIDAADIEGLPALLTDCVYEGVPTLAGVAVPVIATVHVVFVGNLALVTVSTTEYSEPEPEAAIVKPELPHVEEVAGCPVNPGKAKFTESPVAMIVFIENTCVNVVLVLLVEGVKANESPVIVIVIGVIAAFEIDEMASSAKSVSIALVTD